MDHVIRLLRDHGNLLKVTVPDQIDDCTSDSDIKNLKKKFTGNLKKKFQ